MAKINEGLTFVDVAIDVTAALRAAVSACVFGVTVPEENSQFVPMLARLLVHIVLKSSHEDIAGYGGLAAEPV